MKITMYELLGMVKDGNTPKKIKYDDIEFVYGAFNDENKFIKGLDKKNGKSGYYCEEQNGWFEFYIGDILNDTVEILEEEKKIPEKLNYVHPDISCSYNESELLLRIEANKDKINSIIDYLKSKGEE